MNATTLTQSFNISLDRIIHILHDVDTKVRNALQEGIDKTKKFILPTEKYEHLKSKDLKYVFPTTLIDVTYYGSSGNTIYFKPINKEVSRFIHDFMKSTEVHFKVNNPTDLIYETYTVSETVNVFKLISDVMEAVKKQFGR